MTVKIGSLFSGYGGLDIAVMYVLDADMAWHSENDPSAARVLEERFPGVPNLGDITAIDWTTVPPVDVLTGGFPCQDLSTAGRRAGLRAGTRSGLWSHMAAAIDTLRPPLVVVENVRGILSAGADSDLEPCPWCVGDGEGEPAVRALGVVLGDLADLGYDAAWQGLRAADIGAPHGRFRVFLTATPAGYPYRVDREGWPTPGLPRETGSAAGSAAHPDGLGSVRARPARRGWAATCAQRSRSCRPRWRPTAATAGRTSGDRAGI